MLDAVGLDQPVWKHEVFGPVVAVTAFDDLDQALELANGTEYGLQAGILPATCRARWQPSASSASEA